MWSVEITLRRKYKQCTFLAIDHLEINRRVETNPRSRSIKKVSRDKAGNDTILVNTRNQEYTENVIRHQTFAHSLNMVATGQHTIDFLMIDAEGLEFSTIKAFHSKKRF